MTTSLVFRPAQASDASIAVALIYSSGPAAFDYVFSDSSPGGAPGFLHHAFLDGRGEFGCRNHIVAELNGVVVAVGAGYSGSTSLPFMLAAAFQIFRHYGFLAALRVIVRGLRVEAVIPPPSGRSMFYIAHLGVVPELRSQGVGRQLTGHLLQRARLEGYRVAALDVALGNPRAQALYERLGFVLTRERRSGLARGASVVPDHRRMEMVLAKD